MSTVRTWARKGKIPGQVIDGRWMVSLAEVRSRGERLGRIPTAPVDDVAGTPPPGTMIVPLDAWERMLTQLGNLHEAGQQLAEARERAAKAETEVQFLREQLSTLRRPITPEVVSTPPSAPDAPSADIPTSDEDAGDTRDEALPAADIGASPGVLPQPPPPGSTGLPSGRRARWQRLRRRLRIRR